MIFAAFIFFITACGGASTTDVKSTPPPPIDDDPVLTAPEIVYPTVPELHEGTAMGMVVPLNDGGPVSSYADISTEGWRLADYGLALDPATGAVSGTPVRTAPAGETFTIRATGPGGEDTTFLDVLIHPPGSFASLRPTDVFGEIPASLTALGAAPNNTSTSGQTYVLTGHDGSVADEIGVVAPYRNVHTYANGMRENVAYIQGDALQGEFVCDRRDTEYILMGDMTSPTFGIRIAARGITVNLNGHTVTYMTQGLYGAETCTVTDVTTYQIKDANGDTKTYLALGLTGQEGVLEGHKQGYCLQFLDGAEAGTYYQSQKWRTMDFDGNTLASPVMSLDCQVWKNGGPQVGDTLRMADPLQTFGVGVSKGWGLTDIHILNGRILQGEGWGTGTSSHYGGGANPILFYQGPNLEYVGGVYTQHHSTDSAAIFANATGPTVEYCTFRDTGTGITDRHRRITTVDVGQGSEQRPMVVRRCRVYDARHQGISGRTWSIIEYNEVRVDSYATNSPSIGIFSAEHVVCRYNNLYGIGYHPTGIGHHDGVGSNDIYGNWCETMCTSNNRWDEYGAEDAVALSNRWTPWNGRPGENHIHHNVLITHADNTAFEGVKAEARTLWLGALYKEKGVPGEHIYENVIASFSHDGQSWARCVSTGGSADNGAINGAPTIVLKNNTFVSNLCWGHLGERPGYVNGTGYIRFIDNTFRRTDDYDDANFVSFRSVTKLENDMISNDFPDGVGLALDDMALDLESTYRKDLRIGHNLTVRAKAAGVPVVGASVRVLDKDGGVLREGYTTDAAGEVVVDVPCYRITNYDGATHVPGGTTIDLRPIRIEVTGSTTSGNTTASPDADTAVDVTLN